MSEDAIRADAMARIPGATSNESSVAGTPPPGQDSGDRNFVTGPEGTEPVLARETVVTEPAEPGVKSARRGRSAKA